MKNFYIYIGGTEYSITEGQIFNLSAIGSSLSLTTPIATSGNITFSIYRYQSGNIDLWQTYGRVTELQAPSMAYLNKTLHKGGLSFVLNNDLYLTKSTKIIHCGTECLQLTSAYSTLLANTPYTIAVRGERYTRDQVHWVSDYKLNMAAVTEFPTYWRGRDIYFYLDNSLWYRGVLCDVPILDAATDTIQFSAVLLENILSGEFGRDHELKSTTLTPVTSIPEDSVIGYFSARKSPLKFNFVNFNSAQMGGNTLQRVTFTQTTASDPYNKQYARNIAPNSNQFSATTTANLFGRFTYSIASDSYIGQETQDCTVSIAAPHGYEGYDLTITTDCINPACGTTGFANLEIFPVVGMGLTDLTAAVTSNVQTLLSSNLCSATYYATTGTTGINSDGQVASYSVPVAHLAQFTGLEGGVLQIKACTPYTKYQDKFVGFYSRYNRKNDKESRQQQTGESNSDYNKRKNIKQRVLDYGGEGNKNFRAYSWGHLFGYSENDFGSFLGYPIRCITTQNPIQGDVDFTDEDISFGQETVKMYGLRVPMQWMKDENDTTTQVRYIEVVIAKAFWQQGMNIIYLADDFKTFNINQEDDTVYGHQTWDIEFEDYNEGELHAMANICRIPSYDVTFNSITYYAYSIKDAYQTLVDKNGKEEDSYRNLSGSGTAIVPLYGFGNWPGKKDCKLTISPFIRFRRIADLTNAIVVSCEGSGSTAMDILPCGYNLSGLLDSSSLAVLDSPLKDFVLRYNELSVSDLLLGALQLSLSALIGAHDANDNIYKIKAIPILDPYPAFDSHTITDDDLFSPIAITADNEVYTQYEIKYQGVNYTAIDKNAECMFGAGSSLSIDLSKLDTGVDVSKLNWREAQDYNNLFNQIFRSLAQFYGFPRQNIQFSVPLEKAAWWNIGDLVHLQTNRGEEPYKLANNIYGRIMSISHNILNGVTTISITRRLRQYVGWNVSVNVLLNPTEYLDLEYGETGGLSAFVSHVLSEKIIYSSMFGDGGNGLRQAKNEERNIEALRLLEIDADSYPISGIIQFEGYPNYIKFDQISGNASGWELRFDGNITLVGSTPLPNFTDNHNIITMRIILNSIDSNSVLSSLFMSDDAQLLA